MLAAVLTKKISTALIVVNSKLKALLVWFVAWKCGFMLTKTEISKGIQSDMWTWRRDVICLIFCISFKR